MSNAKKSSHTADVIIVGADLHSLLLAQGLRRMGAQVLVLEARDHAALGNAPNLVGERRLPAGLRYIKDSEVARNLLSWAQNLGGMELPIRPIELPPVSPVSGEIREFVGFGDKTFQSRDELSHYMSSQQLDIGSSLEELCEELINSPEIVLRLRHEVTEIGVQNQKVTHVTVNGDSPWVADQYIFSASPHTLLGLMPPEGLEPRNRQKLGKSSSWTTVHLVMAHGKIMSESAAIHFLLSPGQDHQPTLGRWFAPEADGTQFSAWTTFVAPELSEDLEYVGSAVRSLKRQLKKLNEELSGATLAEKLIVLPDHCGSVDLKLKNCRLPEVENLVMASHLLSQERGPIAHLDVAYSVMESFAPTLAQKREGLNQATVAPVDHSC